MADKTYDAIVVGGGHNGLITACYLQRAGLKTGIFELQAKLGGAVTSEEGPVPRQRFGKPRASTPNRKFATSQSLKFRLSKSLFHSE